MIDVRRGNGRAIAAQPGDDGKTASIASRRRRGGDLFPPRPKNPAP
jgi:hypothetical protein